jgi:hypothetical protein
MTLNLYRTTQQMSKIIEEVLEKIVLSDRIRTLEARLSVLQRSSVRDQGALWGHLFKEDPLDSFPVVKRN